MFLRLCSVPFSSFKNPAILRVVMLAGFLFLGLSVLHLKPTIVFAQQSSTKQKSDNSENVSTGDAFLDDLINRKTDLQGRYPYEYYKMLGEGQSLLFENKYYEALGKYEEMQSKFGKTLSVTISMGEIFFKLGDQVSAIRFFQEAEQDSEIKENILWSAVYYRLAMLNYTIGKEEKFLEYLEKIIEEDSNNDQGIISITVSQGIDAMLKVFNLDINYSYEAYRELGLYYMTHNQEDKGVSYSLTALAMVVHWGISNVINNYQPFYVFTDLQYFSETMKELKQGRDFLARVRIDRVLFSLKQYFASNTYKRSRKIASRVIIEPHEYIQNMLEIVANDSILRYSDSFDYYPIIQL